MLLYGGSIDPGLSQEPTREQRITLLQFWLLNLVGLVAVSHNVSLDCSLTWPAHMLYFNLAGLDPRKPYPSCRVKNMTIKN
jgi:hypothetical protein